MMTQLSIFGSRLMCVSFSSKLVSRPMTTPIMTEPVNTSKKTPILSNKLSTVSFPAVAPSRYFCAVSKSTIAIASFRMDSPKMHV